MRLLIIFLFCSLAASAQLDHITIKRPVNRGFVGTVGSTNTFQFTLADSATVSVGIYTSDTTLVRTISSNERLGPGTYIRQWDGLTDYGTIASAGTYHAEVLSSNVKYTWQGARIGNTSTDFVGNPVTGISTIHRAGEGALGIMIAGQKLYYVAGYQERFNTIFESYLTQIGKRQRAHDDNNGSGMATSMCATDGTTNYWGCYNQQGPSFSFVFATNVSNNQIKTFSSGGTVATTAGNAFTSAIAYKGGVAAALSDIQSMAVQKTGTKLFVSRVDTIHVFNKSTGALLQRIYKPGISRLACDTAGNLWVGVGSSVVKYTVNSDGTITTTGVSISGVLSVGAIAVSPNNYNVVICDDDTASQQVKSFNNATGAALWTLGTAGGYMTDASVNNTKFYFRDLRTNYLCGIAFQSDSSFWVIDGGNSRMQHYSAARSYINRIMYLGVNYVLQADPNNINRLYAMWGGGATSNGGYLEFAIDHTKTLDSGMNGSWTLVKNWGARISNDYTYFSKMQNIVTIAGHTYGRMRHETGSIFGDIFELVPGGAARKTKVQFAVRMAIGKDSALYYNPEGAWPMHASNVYKYAFTGLDSDNDPTWSATPQTVVTTPILDTLNAVMPNAEFKPAYTSTNKWVFFDPAFYVGSTGKEPHLGIQSAVGNGYKVKTSLGTLRSYVGDFPVGYFDNGNGVGGPGGEAGGYYTVSGKNIMWTYHGEFWKTSQVNFFNHYYENGLLVGQFGRPRTDYGDLESAEAGAGNALHGSWNDYNSDTAYIYSGDEGVNAGVQRWCVSGLSTIAVQRCNFNSSLTVPALDYVDLMSEIRGKNFFADTGRWTISSPGTFYNSPAGFFWYVPNGSKTPSTFGRQDISAFYVQTSGNRSVSANLGINAALTSWKITGNVTFEGNTPSTSSQGSYLTVIDSTGKYIAALYEYGNGDGADMMGNGVVLQNYSPYGRNSVTRKSKPFEIRLSGSTLYFTYDGHTNSTSTVYQTGAIKANPRTLQLFFSPGGINKSVGVSNLKFYSNYE